MYVCMLGLGLCVYVCVWLGLCVCVCVWLGVCVCVLVRVDGIRDVEAGLFFHLTGGAMDRILVLVDFPAREHPPTFVPVLYQQSHCALWIQQDASARKYFGLVSVKMFDEALGVGNKRRREQARILVEK